MKKRMMRLIVAVVVTFCGANLAVRTQKPLKGRLRVASVRLPRLSRPTIWWISILRVSIS
jgi:hypothetical protein